MFARFGDLLMMWQEMTNLVFKVANVKHVRHLMMMMMIKKGNLSHLVVSALGSNSIATPGPRASRSLKDQWLSRLGSRDENPANLRTR